jgi:hypothetical protein
MSTPPTNQSDVPRTDIDFSLSFRLLVPVAALMAVACGLAWYFLTRPFPVDSSIPHYVKIENVSGNLVSVGSDTLESVKRSRISCGAAALTQTPRLPRFNTLNRNGGQWFSVPRSKKAM